MGICRFSIDNFLLPISFEQFEETASILDISMNGVNPNTTSELFLTTNKEDYEVCSLTIFDSRVEEALNRRERHSLENFNKDLWKKSFETELIIKDNTITDPYTVFLSVRRREPRIMKFYASSLDERSQEVFDSFKKARWFQRIGNSYSKP
ncbi:hypothetical protein J4407_00790 [Candidatus Pacearchaeota archaeon]|nr:hypothetical protein [Candidatus Pacearchaeota archaeon]